MRRFGELKSSLAEIPYPCTHVVDINWPPSSYIGTWVVL